MYVLRRAVKACKGSWVKNVDGDDLLAPSCIADNLAFVEENPDAKLVFSNVTIFSGSDDRKNYGFFFDEKKKSFFKLDAFEQYKRLLYANELPSQSCFVDALLLKENPYNEEYRGLEDAPMWVKLTKGGNKAYYFDTCTAMYRKEESMTKSNKRYFSSIYFESMQKYFWQERCGYIKELELEEAYNHNRRFLLTMEFADVFLNNRRNWWHDVIFKVARRFIYRYIKFHL